MGVRGLQTYLEQYCPEACYKVYLRTLVSKYHSETGRHPEIVIDAPSCYKLWSQGLDWTIGYEMREYIHRLQTFVEAFAKIGAKLVFYFGGLTPVKKRSAWILRRKRNVDATYRAFSSFYSGRFYKDFSKEDNSIPPNMGIVTSFILKYILKCTVYMSIEECDEEIIHYVHEHNSFAIFAQDTDFIVSDVECVVLSSAKFNINEMTTLLYDRQKLINRLKIRNDQLPILAILAGNDLLPFELLRAFHVELCRLSQTKCVPFHVLMPALGEYINRLPKVPIDRLLEFISNAVFKDNTKLEEIRLSYSSYLIHEIPRSAPSVNKWMQILRVAKYRMKNIIAPLIVWSVINDQTFEISVALEDLRKIHDKNKEARNIPSATVSRTLRQRLYGILLREKEDTTVIVKEWCGENTTSYEEPVVVSPIYSDLQHPGLLALWSEDNGDRLNLHKWTLFLNAVSPTIKNISEWMSLDEEIVLSTAVCYYLWEQKYILKWELHAVLATVVLHPLYDRSRLQLLSADAPNLRAIQLSVTYIRTYGVVMALLSACGYPVSMSKDTACMKFEGKLFQHKFRQAVKKARYKELCDNDNYCLRLFYKMKNMIYREPKNAESQVAGSSAVNQVTVERNSPKRFL